MKARKGVSKLWLGLGGLLVVFLLAAVFTLGSLNIPFEPRTWNELVVLYALSTFIVAALLVFGLVLTRSLLRLWAERRAEQLGARFKTKMVFGAMAISLLPLVFLFFISYALLNRTLNKWFPRPLEIATAESQKLLVELGKSEFERLRELAQEGSASQSELPWAELALPVGRGADAAWAIFPAEYGKPAPLRARISLPGRDPDMETAEAQRFPRLLRVLPSGAEVWMAEGRTYLAARASTRRGDGTLLVARAMPEGFLERYSEIETQVQTYEAQKQGLRAFKTQMLLTLLLFTVLLLFSATWAALFLSKLVTVPIQALAEATREVSAGHFDHRVEVQARDELGILVSSFNQMTAQLAESRHRVEQSTRSLQQALEEIERRRKLMETILENIPTGVLSLDDRGAILRTNPAVTRIFGERARTARTLAELTGEEAVRSVEALMRKSLRMGVASRELEISLPERVLHAAVTVSSLGPRRANPGFVVVIDDLTELLRVQKAAAWQEVAQRIAHEIKNPLTPIQLSAQRLARYLERHTDPGAHAGVPMPRDELSALVAECAGLIEREVGTLESLVEEFSRFARFPSARPVPSDLNAIVTSALEVFSGRMEGMVLRTELARDLGPVKADPDLLRRVVVNLIDNAAEAMEGSAARELTVATRLDSEGEAAEVLVADCGHGISPEDKDKLFLPHFSTKERGTGLGLAIASRIVAEHGGTLRVEDNQPVGARFVIRLPLAEVPAAAPRNGRSTNA